MQVVDQVEKGDMTYKQAQSHYGIQGRSTVLVWLRKHGKMAWPKSDKQIMPNTPKSKQSPAQKIKRLERELEGERLRNLLLNEAVDIMELQYGAGIRKILLAKGLENFKQISK